MKQYLRQGLLLSALLLSLAACATDPNPNPGSADVAQDVDTVGVGAEADTAFIGPTIPPAFAAEATEASDEVAASAEAAVGQEAVDDAVVAELDSLRRAVERLTALVGALAANPAALADTTTAASADTAAAAEGTLLPGERLRETAQDVRNIGLRTLWALLVIAVFFFVVKGGVWVLEALAERNAARRLFFKKLVPIVRLLAWTMAIYYIVAVVYGINQDQLFAASAALGVAIGFAAQDVLKNIFGGIIIVFDQPFQVGDKIAVGGTYGEVVSIGLRSTRIVTPDDNLVSVPNAQVVDGQVSNANAGALDCQVVTDLYLPGWVDPGKAKAIAYDAAANSKYVYLDKPIVVNVKDEFKETFLTHLRVKAYVLDTRYENALVSDVTETAKAEFIRHGMLIPFAPPLEPEATNGRQRAGREESHE